MDGKNEQLPFDLAFTSPPNACSQRLVSRITIVFPSPNAAPSRLTSSLLTYIFRWFLHEAQCGGDSIFSFTQRPFHLMTPAQHPKPHQ